MTVKEKIYEVIKTNTLMHVATIDEDGNPNVRGVDYIDGDQENEIFFITNKFTHKIEEIKINNKVAVSIDKDCTDFKELKELKYLKALGIAEIIEDQDTIEEVFTKLAHKYPYMKNLPIEPDEFVAIRIVLKEISLIDNSLGIGHMEGITFTL